MPFLAHQFAKAAKAGITHIVLATAYRASMFAECFGDGAAFGLEISYVHEPEPLGTGGAIRNAASGLRSSPDSPVRRAERRHPVRSRHLRADRPAPQG